MDSLKKIIPTSATIAQRLGLSRATVSYVLNGQFRERKISPATAKRVLAMAEELGYVPNELARSLRRQKSRVIGISVSGLGYHYVERFMLGMLPVFDREGYTPFLSPNYRDPVRERRELTMMLQRRMDGIIAVPLMENVDLFRHIIQEQVPLVFLTDVPEGLPEASYILWDGDHATRTAVRHLWDIGCRRIGYIGPGLESPSSRMRYYAFIDEIKQHGQKPNEDYVHLEPFQPTGGINSYLQQKDLWRDALYRICASRQGMPDALVLYNDPRGFMILDLLTDMGIRVPEDIALIGQQDGFMADHAGVSLSTIREPTSDLAREAIDALFTLLLDPHHPPIQKVIRSSELIARRTTDIQRQPAHSRTASKPYLRKGTKPK